MVTEAVAQEGFLSFGFENRVMLCTEVEALAGSDATAASVDESVLAAAPVPEGSLIAIHSVTSSAHPGNGDADGGHAPQIIVQFTCRNPRIHDVVDKCYVRDQETRKPKVHVWTFRVSDPRGETLDYRFRARIKTMGSYGNGDENDVVTVFLTPLDRHPTITRPQAHARQGP